MLDRFCLAKVVFLDSFPQIFCTTDIVIVFRITFDDVYVKHIILLLGCHPGGGQPLAEKPGVLTDTCHPLGETMGPDKTKKAEVLCVASIARKPALARTVQPSNVLCLQRIVLADSGVF